MDTQDPDKGSVDPVETSTTSLDSTAPATPASEDEFDEESHEPCGTSHLFNDPYRRFRERRPTDPTKKATSLTNRVRTLNTISRLRLGSAAACHNCKIVLDAVLSYSSGRLPLDNIEQVEVLPEEDPMTMIYRPGLDAGEGSNEPGLREVELELFQLEGQTSEVARNYSRWTTRIPTRKLPSEDTSSDRALQTLHNWIETCVEHHGDCAGRKITPLPKRILEIEGTHVYLRERVNKSAMYACLSHCWGPTGPTIRLDNTSLGRLRDGMIIDQLPKTFAEACHLCERLGIGFLWIDACCIMQDDKNDWEETAATMANIYELAHLTIAATWASNSDSGLFASDRERYEARKLRCCELYVREKPDAFPPSARPSRGFPLLTRAWVYQERLLSSRMVHFGKDQMYWECSTLFTAESGLTFQDINPLKVQRNNTFSRFNDDPVSRWQEMITTYSGLKLTYANDRLPAIAAIVEREMQWRKDDTYIAGMWTSSLLTNLLWFAENAIGSPSLPRLSNSIPTWSWPSSRDRIHWHDGSIVPSLRLVDVSFTRVGPPHIGEVANASITLEGHTCMTRLTHIREPELQGFSYLELVLPPYEGAGVSKSCFMHMDFDWTTGDRPVTTGATFISILMKISSNYGSYCFGLVLREMADGSFERMGTICIEAEPRLGASREEFVKILSDFVESLPIRQVKII